MTLLDQLKQKIKVKNQKSKEQDKKLKETKTERPLSRVFDFLQNRQEVRLGVLYSLRNNQNHVVKDEQVIESKKTDNVTYIS